MDRRDCSSTDGLAAQQTGSGRKGRRRRASGGGLTGVSHGDLRDLIGVEPDLPLAALEDGSGKPLLELERNHGAAAAGDGTPRVCGGVVAERMGGRVEAAPRLIYPPGIRVPGKASQVG